MKKLILLSIILVSLSACSSLVSFQTGRTIGADKFGVQLNGSVYGFTDNNENFTTPFVEIEGSYGITNWLEAKLALTSAINSKGALKFQLIGTQSSKFALSLEPGLEYQLGNINVSSNAEGIIERYHFPVHMSIHDERGLGFYLSPKYMLQNADEFTHFAGFSTGIAIDRKNTYFIGAGYFIPINAGSGIQGQLFQIGAGIRFNL
jgi:hypothetical protein